MVSIQPSSLVLVAIHISKGSPQGSWHRRCRCSRRRSLWRIKKRVAAFLRQRFDPTEELWWIGGACGGVFAQHHDDI